MPISLMIFLGVLLVFMVLSYYTFLYVLPKKFKKMDNTKKTIIR